MVGYLRDCKRPSQTTGDYLGMFAPKYRSISNLGAYDQMVQFMQFLMRFALSTVFVGCLYVLFGAIGGDWHWSFDLAGQFLLPAIITACLGAIGAGIARLSFAAAGFLALGVVLALVSVPWTSAPSSVPANAPRFSVLLFNVWYRNQDLDGIRKLIERKNPDLVVLIEATSRIRDGLKAVVARYPYHLDCLDTAGCGVLMFSRSRLSPQDVQETHDPMGSPLVSVSAQLGGCRMTVFATHLTRPYPFAPTWVQSAQAEEIGDEVAAWGGTKLLVGDFNASPWGHVMGTIASRGHLDILKGPGGTWPSVLPQRLRIPIDHMLVSSGLSFLSREVLPSPGSDHAPVFARIAVTDATQCSSHP